MVLDTYDKAQALRPVTLTISALDPCGGAGMLADIKTFEQHYTLGMGVLTAITAQTEKGFFYFKSLTLEEITHLLVPLMEYYTIRFIKIGMISHSLLLPLLQCLHSFPWDKTIVWDPVLKTTSGFTLERLSAEEYTEILSQVSIFVPNFPEYEIMKDLLNKDAESMSQLTCLIIKGGHLGSAKGRDELYVKGNKVREFFPLQLAEEDKRGTGCIFSSSLLAYLAHGLSLEKAIVFSKQYIEKILVSNPGLLAYHAS